MVCYRSCKRAAIAATNGYFYPDAAQPQFRTVDFYFARSGGYHPDYINYIDPIVDSLPWQPAYFSPTNPTPAYPYVIPFARPFGITAWSKQAVTNGYPGVFAYAEEYFDKALLADTNGNITTNSAGIL